MWSALASALVAITPVDGEPPTLDVFLDDDVTVQRSVDDDARARDVATRVYVSHWETRTGTPTSVWLPAPAVGTRAPRDIGLTAEESARRVLFDLAPLYRSQPERFARARLSFVHDLGQGAVVVSFHRAVDDVPVFRERLAVVMTHEFIPVAVLGTLSPHAAPALRFQLTAETALNVALESIGAAGTHAPRALSVRDGWTLRDGGNASRRVVYAAGNELIPAWQLELDVRDVGAFTVVVSARDGRVLSRASRTSHAGFRVFARSAAPFTPLDGPYADAAPHPTGLPDGWAPATLTPAVLVTLEHAGLSTMDPWLPPQATTLSGNNAIAYADVFAPTGRNEPGQGLPRLPDGGLEPGVTLPDGGSSRNHADPFPSATAGAFDFAYDTALEPSANDTQHFAAATHAFFTVNWLHDLFYDVGFNERAGNAQADNKGRGGIGQDPLLVEVNDFASAGTSRFVAAPDGLSPRIELFPVEMAGRATATFSPALAIDAGTRAAPMRPGAWNVTAPVVRAWSVDGGLDLCGPWTNTSAISGSVLLARATGPCAGSLDSLDDVAADAGAVGVLVLGGFDARVQGISVPMQVLDTARGEAVLASLDAGVAVTATLERTLAVGRSAALDTSLVAHEFGHLLASRLTNGGLISSQGRAVAEGTGDVVALLALLEAADLQKPGNTDWRGAFAVGPYAASPTLYDGTSSNAWLFGVRRFPYSVDMTKNALTLRHIVSNVPLPSTPVSPLELAALDNAAAHNAGEVWASAVWEISTRLLKDPRYGNFETARKRALELVVASLKATPATPTLIEARDAYLAVARATGTAELTHGIAGFAVRGLGLAAQSFNRRSPTNAPVAEDFTASGSRWVLLDAKLVDDRDSCDNDGVLDSGETGELELTLMNVGIAALTGSRINVGSDDTILVLDEMQVTAPVAQPFSTVTVRVAAEPRDGLPGIAQSRIFVSSPDGFLDTMTPATRFIRLNTDVVPATRETFEADVSAWNFGREGIEWENGFRVNTVQNRLLSGTLFAPSAPNAGLLTATSPPLVVGTTALSFTFDQAYGFESNGTQGIDGAQLRISVDSGPFTTIPSSAIMRTIGMATFPGYDGRLVSRGDNPLAGQEAFFGTGPQQTVTVSLGTQYAGRTVRLQFVAGFDTGGTSTGWTMDVVDVVGLTNQPFNAAVPQRGVCVNKPPVMQVALPQSFDERTRAVLTPPSVTDPNGDTVTFRWERTSGPMVTVTGNEFDAPEVRSDTQLTFRLTADDGRGGTATQTVAVTVRNVNRTPTSSAGESQRVTSGTTVTLQGAAEDADADTLTIRWTQLGGPEVTFSSVDDLHATFVAPNVTTPTEVNLELNVSDGPAAAAPARVTFVITPKGCGCSSPGWAPALLALVAVLRARRSRR